MQRLNKCYDPTSQEYDYYAARAADLVVLLCEERNPVSIEKLKASLNLYGLSKSYAKQRR